MSYSKMIMPVSHLAMTFKTYAL